MVIIIVQNVIQKSLRSIGNYLGIEIFNKRIALYGGLLNGQT
jgi:hypothetical protein